MNGYRVKPPMNPVSKHPLIQNKNTHESRLKSAPTAQLRLHIPPWWHNNNKECAPQQYPWQWAMEPPKGPPTTRHCQKEYNGAKHPDGEPRVVVAPLCNTQCQPPQCDPHPRPHQHNGSNPPPLPWVCPPKGYIVFRLLHACTTVGFTH